MPTKTKTVFLEKLMGTDLNSGMHRSTYSAQCSMFRRIELTISSSTANTFFA